MKKVFLALSIAVMAFVSCSKDATPAVVDIQESYIVATSSTTWHYYSFSSGTIVGTGEQTPPDNAKWFARTDWDIAINKYNVRTNSGAATTTGANGGVYICPSSVVFNTLDALPAQVQFAADKAVTSSAMGGSVTTTIRSEASVILFKTGDDGSMIMPPVYLQAPVYVFRTADGKEYYKVQFTQYLDENKASGHVKFYSAQIK